MSRIPTFADSPVVHLDASTSIETAIMKFKKRVTAAQIFRELKKRECYVPKSVRRRLKARKARARRAQAARVVREMDWKPSRDG